MRIGQVIGKVVMGQQDPAFKGARWLLVNPLDAEQFNSACATPPSLTGHFTTLVFDQLGAGERDIVGFVEGAEATAPFDDPTPIDAITVAIFDSLNYVPHTT